VRRLSCVFFLVAAGIAGEPEQLDKLLADLGSPDPHVREAATRALIDACDDRGGEGLRWLDTAAMVPDPEVRKRVGVVRRDLELRRKVRHLLDTFATLELPDARKEEFVRFETESRAGYGWAVPNKAVIDTSLRSLLVLHRQPYDFDAYCKEALKQSREERTDHAGNPYVLERLAFRNTLLSLWSWQRGHKRVAIEFLREANRALHRGKKFQPLSLFIRARVSRRMAARAVRAAIGGEPRTQLVKHWEAARDVKGPGFVANDFLRAYASLIEEDAKHKEPTPAERTAMPPDARARYWLYHLRDSRADASSLGPPTDPSRQLLALGWDAVPALIEYLQDTRPTRGATPAPDRLMRYGDVCAELVLRITGREFRSRGRAEDWWSDVEDAGVESYLIESLEESRLRLHAARALLQLDAAHAPRLVALAWAKDPRLLPVVAKHVKDDECERVAGLLKYKSRPAVLAVARVLWERFGDDRGLRQILAAYEKGGDDHLRSDCGEIEFLCASRAPAAIAGVVRFVERGPPGIRALFNFHAYRAVDARVLDALLLAMEDRASWAKVRGRGGRTCDRAALSVARMLRLKRLSLSNTVEDRDRELDRFAAWVRAHRDKLDWDALRR